MKKQEERDEGFDEEFWTGVSRITDQVAEKVKVKRDTAALLVMMELVAAHLSDIEMSILWVSDDEEDSWKAKDEDEDDDDAA